LEFSSVLMHKAFFNELLAHIQRLANELNMGNRFCTIGRMPG